MKRIAVLLLPLFLASALTACGKAVVENETPYYFARSQTDTYTFTAHVKKIRDTLIANSIDTDIFVNGERQDMSGSGTGAWTFSRIQTGSAGFRVSYRLSYEIPYLLAFPLEQHDRAPASGVLQVPVLGDAGGSHVGDPDGDIDRDGVLDRYENCPFHPNPDQVTTTGSPLIGDPCDAGPATRFLVFESDENSPDFAILARDTSAGNVVLVNNGNQIIAFQRLESAVSRVTAQSGFASLAPVDLETQVMTTEFGDCFLMHQDPDGGASVPAGAPFGQRFVQIYASNTGGSDCTFRITIDGLTVLTGTDVLIAVITNNNGTPSSNAQWGRARVFGRVTLTEPDSPPEIAGVDPQALYDELTNGSATSYIYFAIGDYDPVELNGADARSVSATGTFSANGFFTVN